MQGVNGRFQHAWRGGKFGSPTQREVMLSAPSASICFTREKISTGLEGLIWDRSGLSDGGGSGGDVVVVVVVVVVVDDEDDDASAAAALILL